MNYPPAESYYQNLKRFGAHEPKGISRSRSWSIDPTDWTDYGNRGCRGSLWLCMPNRTVFMLTKCVILPRIHLALFSIAGSWFVIVALHKFYLKWDIDRITASSAYGCWTSFFSHSTTETQTRETRFSYMCTDSPKTHAINVIWTLSDSVCNNVIKQTSEFVFLFIHLGLANGFANNPQILELTGNQIC